MQSNVDIIREQFKCIDFPDAEFVSALIKGSRVHLLIKDWRERRIHLRFGEVVLFKSFEFGGGIYECHILSESNEINEAIEVIRQNYGSVPDEHGFVHLSLIDDVPIIVVVFRSLEIEIES